MDEQHIPTKAEFLADLLQGCAQYSSSMTTVQRSHRFPMHIFLVIENMARMAGMPISTIINLLLESGLEAVLRELPEEQVKQLHAVLPEQLSRKTQLESVKIKPNSKSSVRVKRNP